MTPRISREKCAVRESDLLLLLHGELPRSRRQMLTRHLRRCADCQARFQTLSAVSHGMAASLRGPKMPTWKPTVTASPVPRRFVVAALTVFLALTGLIYGIWRQTTEIHSAAPAASTQDDSQPCRPGLPHDRCN